MCTTVIVGKNASTTGRVIVGHNEDAGGRSLHQQFFVPSEKHAEGEVVTAEPGRAAVPQVSETLPYYWSNMMMPGGSSFDQGFANAAGVVICSNGGGTSYPADEMTEEEVGLKDGGIGFLLRRLVAERAHSAREAVKIACELLDIWGYFGAARNYTFADKDEAWYMNVVKGRRYVAKRVPDDEVVLISNMLCIRICDLNDKENVILAPGLLDDAKASGRWNGTDPFDFAMIYQSDENRHAPTKSHRMRLGWEAIAGVHCTDELHYPEVLKPTHKMSADDVKAVLRITNPTTFAERGDGRADAFHVSAVDISRSHTRESWVMELAERPVMNILWRTASYQDTGAYVPWFPLAGTIPTCCQWTSLEEARERCFNPTSDALALDFDRNYWTYAVLGELVNFNRGLFAGVHSVRDDMEAHFAKAVDAVRAEVEGMDDEAAAKRLGAFTTEMVEKSLDAYRELLADLNMVKATGPAEISSEDTEAEIEIRIQMDCRKVDLASLFWSFGFTTAKPSVNEPARALWVRVEHGVVRAAFRAGDVTQHATKKVLCDTYVRGYADHKRFVAMVPMTIV